MRSCAYGGTRRSLNWARNERTFCKKVMQKNLSSNAVRRTRKSHNVLSHLLRKRTNYLQARVRAGKRLRSAFYLFTDLRDRTDKM